MYIIYHIYIYICHSPVYPLTEIEAREQELEISTGKGNEFYDLSRLQAVFWVFLNIKISISACFSCDIENGAEEIVHQMKASLVSILNWFNPRHRCLVTSPAGVTPECRLMSKSVLNTAVSTQK